MMAESRPRVVDDAKELLRLLSNVSTRVLWKTSGRGEATSGMDEHRIEQLPEGEGLSIGLAVARSSSQMSVRVSVVVHTEDVYARADTSTTYEWPDEIEVPLGTARELLRVDGVQRALATSCGHVVDAAMTVGADVENPALRFQDKVLEMVESESVFE